uniref:Dihydroorotate dehydrogenase catalytic domain-containing protein n=1 Tax=Oryza meridionalis TaxID=40149 RepID=A0A0E0DK46_9ORYZ
MWQTGPRTGTKPQYWAAQPIFHARPDSLILSSLKPSSPCFFCLLPTPTQSRRRPRRHRRRRPSPPSPAGPPRAAPMSSSAAALAWRRSLRDSLLRGSAWRGTAAAARSASTASASEAAAGAAAGPKKVPPPPRKGRLLTGAMIGLAIAGGAYVSTADEANAVINRCGFNSEGIVVVAKRLGAQHGKRKMEETSSSTSPTTSDVKQGGKAGPGILGVNLGKNKISEDATADYVQGVHTLSQYADYLVQAARDEMQWAEDGPPPLLVKIAPDLSKQDLEDIAAVALALRLDGLIISNTTISRPSPADTHPLAQEAGGLSGKPLFDLSTNVLREIGEDAYKKIRSGATLVQLYTAFAYGGPALIPRIKAELAECLERDGFKSVQEAVGADFK